LFHRDLEQSRADHAKSQQLVKEEQMQMESLQKTVASSSAEICTLKAKLQETEAEVVRLQLAHIVLAENTESLEHDLKQSRSEYEKLEHKLEQCQS
jgi:chromosome segregation ATPase